MSRRVRQYMPILKKISRMGDVARRRYLKNCDKALMDCFSECAKNVLKGNVPLSKRQFSRLEREKTNVRALASKRTSLRKKRRVVQRGGFIGALLMPAVAALGSLLVNRMLSND